MRFSILICSMFKRRNFLTRILNVIDKQIKDFQNVECLTNTDDGRKPVGMKRNELLDKAKGEYIAFVDDDDLISDDYIRKIMDAISTKPDCVGIEGIITTNGINPKKFIHSLKFKEWFEKDGIYYRNPNHLSPVKREHALKARFPQEKYFGEDAIYSMKLLPCLLTEVYIEGPIYFYQYSDATSETKRHQGK